VILFSHCQKRKTRSIRGDHIPNGDAATAVSAARQPTIIGHWQRRKQSSTKSTMSSAFGAHCTGLAANIHDPAYLVAAEQSL
jgi:hypothetical protein